MSSTEAEEQHKLWQGLQKWTVW